MSIRLSNIFAVCCTALIIAGAFAYSALAQNEVTYPIAELGSCASKEECKAFCGEEANRDACQAYAETHNLKGAGQAKIAIMEDGGPGGCGAGQDQPLIACREYCNDAAHIEECVAYAKTHNFKEGPKLERAEKIAAAIASGIALPDGCTDGASCRNVCKDPATVDIAKQCFDFGEAAGLLPEGATREKAEKLFSLIEDGDAPFNSLRGFAECRTTTDQEVKNRCIEFAEKNDLLPPRTIGILKSTGGVGPGGCTDPESCKAYCTEHRDECFAFAQENNILSDADKTRIAEGAARLRTLLSGLPENAKSCVREALGTRFDGIEAGTDTPLPDDGERIRKCVEVLQQSGIGGILPKALRPNASSTDPTKKPPLGDARPEQPQIPIEVRNCALEKLGIAGPVTSTTPVDQDVFKKAIEECMQMFRGQGMSTSTRPVGGAGSPGSGELDLRLRACLVQKLGEARVVEEEQPTVREKTKEFLTALEACRTMLKGTSGTTPTVPKPPILPGGGGAVVCPADAKICSDGSSVGRTGPKCEFALCPGETKPDTASGTTRPCTTLEECKKFCSAGGTATHPVICREVMQGMINSSGSGTIQSKPTPGQTQPGAVGAPCNSLESCKIFCSNVANVTKEVCVKLHNGVVPSAGGAAPPPPPSAVPGSDTSATQPTSSIANPIHMVATLVFSLFFKE